MGPTFEMDLTDAGYPGCWPIASATYILVPLTGRNGNSFRVLEFFEQALQHGDAHAVYLLNHAPAAAVPR